MNYILTERAIYDFCQTDYFKDYLADTLKDKSEISIEDANFKIENFKLLDPCLTLKECRQMNI